MKRNEKKVPGFDEIIFRNRNKEYGAYDLRRRYKSAASLSIVGVSVFFTALIMLISSLISREATARTDKGFIVPIILDKYNTPKMVQPELKKPAMKVEQPKYVPPKVVDDTFNIPNTLMTTDDALGSIKDGIVVDKIDSLTTDISPVPVKKDEEIFIKVEESPVFPGGDIALLKYIADNTKYPAEAIEINLEGKVIVKFAVMSDGSVSKVQTIRSINPLLDQEAIRVVSSLPQWKPGKQNGKPVSVWFSVPVTFQLLK
jgi:periplasmic protein TonB